MEKTINGKKATLEQIRDKLNEICEYHEAHRHTYFWTPSRNAGGRDAKRVDDTTIILLGARRIKCEQQYHESCNNCYYSSSYWVDRKGYNITGVKKFLTSLDKIEKEEQKRYRQLKKDWDWMLDFQTPYSPGKKRILTDDQIFLGNLGISAKDAIDIGNTAHSRNELNASVRAIRKKEYNIARIQASIQEIGYSPSVDALTYTPLTVQDAIAYLSRPLSEISPDMAEGKRDNSTVAFVTVPGRGNMGKMQNGSIMHQEAGGKCWHQYGTSRCCKD